MVGEKFAHAPNIFPALRAAKECRTRLCEEQDIRRQHRARARDRHDVLVADPSAASKRTSRRPRKGLTMCNSIEVKGSFCESRLRMPTYLEEWQHFELGQSVLHRVILGGCVGRDQAAIAATTKVPQVDVQ
jgi:hypothetical protein